MKDKPPTHPYIILEQGCNPHNPNKKSTWKVKPKMSKKLPTLANIRGTTSFDKLEHIVGYGQIEKLLRTRLDAHIKAGNKDIIRELKEILGE